MKKVLIITFLFTSFGLICQPVVVDTERFAFDPDISYNSQITSPKDFHGYELGEAFTVYSDVQAFFKNLASQSNRVAYNEYGTTYEGRPLINLVISSEENMSRIDEIREKHLELLSASSSEAQQIIDSEPVFTSFSYNIHGNEASSTEAAMQVAYRLAAGQDEASFPWIL
jgi:hypothetical protein